MPLKWSATSFRGLFTIISRQHIFQVSIFMLINILVFYYVNSLILCECHCRWSPLLSDLTIPRHILNCCPFLFNSWPFVCFPHFYISHPFCSYSLIRSIDMRKESLYFSICWTASIQFDLFFSHWCLLNRKWTFPRFSLIQITYPLLLTHIRNLFPHIDQSFCEAVSNILLWTEQIMFIASRSFISLKILLTLSKSFSFRNAGLIFPFKSNISSPFLSWYYSIHYSFYWWP